MKASDVMTRNVISIHPNSSIVDAARKMLNNNISGMPVVDDQGELVGMLTEGDLLRRQETETQRVRPRWLEFLLGPGRLAEEYVHISSRNVGDVMTRSALTASEDTPLEKVVRQMERHRIKRLPVIRGKTVVGMITRTNLVRALVNATDEDALAKNDVAIRDRLIAELKKQPWAPFAVDVTVHEGEVTLTGTVLDDRLRDALRVAAENVPGVKKVHDQVAYLEPISGAILET